jgi:hypothetical protein
LLGILKAREAAAHADGGESHGAESAITLRHD